MCFNRLRNVHQHSIVGRFVLGIRGVDLKVLDGGETADGLPLMLDALVAAGTGCMGSHFDHLKLYCSCIDEGDERRKLKPRKKRQLYIVLCRDVRQ